ncbi:MAG TPA: imidazolonepropionase [Syntrophorhabdales bacterium]|nr:imidazolonepropionase [Syntrophorhabdales bacterium]
MTKMGGNLIIRNAEELVTVSGFAAKKGSAMADLGIIRDGALVIDNGIITRVGPTDEVLTGIDSVRYSVIDATGKAVLPGFVDAHTHFVFGGYRAEEFCFRLRGMSYMEIMQRGGGIASSVEATRSATKDQLIMSGKKRLDRMLSFGVTTIEGKSGYGLDLETEIKQLEVMKALDACHPVDIVRTFLGAHAIPKKYRGDPDGYTDHIIREVLPEIARRGLAEFCDVFCEKGVFDLAQSRHLLEAAGTFGLASKLHADELTPLGGAELAAELGAVSADHLLYASEDGIRRMAARDVVAVLLPATAFSLKEPYAPARMMIDRGCAVALATDFNPGSCFSESIPLIFALATLYMGMTPEEAVTACTLNGAAALGRAGIVGSLNPGKQGDLVVLEFPSYLFIPYHVGVNCVEKVVKKGEVVYDLATRERGNVTCS